MILAGIALPDAGGGAALFVLGMGVTAVLVVAEVRAAGRAGTTTDAVTVARRAVLIAMAVAVPAVFDPRTFDVFNLVKFATLASGALVLAVLGAVDLGRGRIPVSRSAVTIALAVLVGWTAVATVFSTNPAVSVLGFYKSYDGLATTAAVAIVFLSVVDAFHAGNVGSLLRGLLYGGGGLTVLYGTLQLHDHVAAAGGRWDWVDWGEASFKNTAIWSTFGNPNHLAGFLATLVPLAIVLTISGASRWSRIGAAAIGGLALVQILQTTTRGAWLATVAGVAALGVLLAPDIRRRASVAGAVGAGLAVAVAAAMALVGPHRIVRQLSSIVDFGGRSSGAQRIELWRSAASMTADHPLTGVGPDSYRIGFASHQTDRFVELFGANQLANGAHNLVANTAASLGLAGLAAFFALLATVAAVAWQGWRTLRTAERAGTEGARERRMLLAATVAAVVAYLVQASFNVQQVALSFVFFVLLAVTVVLGRGDAAPPARPDATPDWNRRGWLVFAPVAVVALGLGWVTLRAYRADYAYVDGLRHLANEDAAGAEAAYERASGLNGWEIEYRKAAADAANARAAAVAEQPGAFRAADVALHLRSMAAHLDAARRLVPDDPALMARHGVALLQLAEVTGDDGPRSRGFDALAAAVEAAPLQPEYAQTLASALAAAGRRAEAVEVLDAAIRRVPDNRVKDLREARTEL